MTSCHIGRPVVRQLIVELDQSTVRRQNSRHRRHPNRNTQADHQTPRDRPNGRTAKKILFSVSRCRTDPGSRCTACIVVYVTFPGGGKSCPGIACIFPGLTGQSNVSVETALVRLPKTGCSSRELVACCETGPRLVEPAKANSGCNALKCSRNCSRFVRLPSPETGRPRLGRETDLLKHMFKGPRPNTPGYGCGYQICVRRFLIGRTVLRFGSARSSSEGFLPATSTSGLPSGSPENWPGFRLRVSIRPNGVNLRAPASGRRPPGSSLFDPEDCLRFSARNAPTIVSPLTWTGGYVFGFPCLESNWRDYCSGSSVNRQGRNWASGSTTVPIIGPINDG